MAPQQHILRLVILRWFMEPVDTAGRAALFQKPPELRKIRRIAPCADAFAKVR
jgi:hypothetical protein